MQHPKKDATIPITPSDAYTLVYRLIAAARPEPIIDAEACADWLTAQPPAARPSPPVRRGSFADYALEFPEAED